MTVLRFVTSLLLALLLAGCSIFETLGFQRAENSGITETQKVTLNYLTPTMSQLDLTSLKLPAELIKACPKPAGQKILTLPFIAAGTTALVDILLGAIDGYRARLKQRAVASYGATVVLLDLALGADPSLPQCIIVTRHAEGQEDPVMVLVNLLQDYKDPADTSKVLGYTWNFAFLRVTHAAAQTAAVEDGNPTIKFTQSLALAAIQPHPSGSGTKVVTLASEASFRISKVELGQSYINRQLPGLDDNTDKDLKDLDATASPLFSRLTTEKTLASLAVNIIERGSAADFDDISAAEKSLREALRDAIGEELESRLDE